MDVHRHLGIGFKEVVYKDALEVELTREKIPYEREKRLQVYYRDQPLNRCFEVDFLVFGCIILEVKATSLILAADFRQSQNYLRVSGLQLAILINFGKSRIEFKRIVCSH